MNNLTKFYKYFVQRTKVLSTLLVLKCHQPILSVSDLRLTTLYFTTRSSTIQNRPALLPRPPSTML